MSQPQLRHVEWFPDHARLEPLLVDGAAPVTDGTMRTGHSPGHGMTLAGGAGRRRLGARRLLPQLVLLARPSPVVLLGAAASVGWAQVTVLAGRPSGP